MTSSLRVRAAVVSIVLLAAFLGIWHLATRPTAAATNMSPEYAKLMKEAGLTPPTTTTKSFAVMGKTFDPAKPEEYLASFKIRKAS